MKKLLFILTLLISINALGQAVNNNPRVFNVKVFGAKGDGVTNDKTAIQNALNACAAAGGGQVYFPDGVFLVTGLVTSLGGVNPNSILTIPQVLSSRDTNRTSIELIGETAPNFIPNTYDTTAAAAYQATRRGSILYTTTTGSGSAPCILGSIAGSGAFQNFNYQNVMVKNMTFLVKSNSTGGGPTVGGINMAANMNFIGENIVVTIDSSAARNGLPTNEVCGIIMPIKNAEQPNALTNVLVVGFKYGIYVGDHSSIDRTDVAYCRFGYLFGASSFAIHAKKFSSEGCITPIYFPASAILGISGNVGTTTVIGQGFEASLWTGTGYWYDYNKVISDSSNYGFGNIVYHTIQNGGGGPNINGLIDVYNATNLGLQPSRAKYGIYRTDQNAATSLTLQNSTSGTLAQAYYTATSNSKSGYFGVTSTAFTTANGIAAEDAFVFGSSTPLNLAATSTIKFTTATAEAMRVNANGRLLIGQTTDDGSSKVQVTGTTALAATNVSGTFTATGTGNFTNTGTTPLSVIGSNATRVTHYVQATNTASQATFYLENNRGSFASYGGMLYGGATNATGNLFGVSRADKLMFFADGASNLGFYTGTLVAQPYVIGTNNTERFKITGTGSIVLPATNTTVGTTGNQTINKPSGTVNIAAAGTTVTVTNSLVTTSSLVFAEIRTNDATARVTSVVPAAGSFVINIVACTAEVSIGFYVIN